MALAIGDGKSAEVAARAALSAVDREAFSRHPTLYTVSLASILTQRRQLDEAISVTSDAIHGVQEVRGSGQVIANLRRTVDLLSQQKYEPATTFATAARRLLPSLCPRWHGDPGGTASTAAHLDQPHTSLGWAVTAQGVMSMGKHEREKDENGQVPADKPLPKDDWVRRDDGGRHSGGKQDTENKRDDEEK